MTNNKDYPRHVRVGDQLQRELSYLVRNYIKDPRLDAVPTISAVNVTSDLGTAKVYINTLFGDPEFAVEILNEYAGKLRGELGRRMKIRAIPKLTFLFDSVQEEATALSSLIERAINEDKQHPDYQSNTKPDSSSTDQE